MIPRTGDRRAPRRQDDGLLYSRGETVERRSAAGGRRSTDHAKFSECPKYVRHDLTEEQIREVAIMAAEVAIQKSEQAIGNFVIHKGGGFLIKAMFILGAMVCAFYTWLSAHNFKF